MFKGESLQQSDPRNRGSRFWSGIPSKSTSFTLFTPTSQFPTVLLGTTLNLNNIIWKQLHVHQE